MQVHKAKVYVRILQKGQVHTHVSYNVYVNTCKNSCEREVHEQTKLVNKPYVGNAKIKDYACRQEVHVIFNTGASSQKG